MLFLFQFFPLLPHCSLILAFTDVVMSVLAEVSEYIFKLVLIMLEKFSTTFFYEVKNLESLFSCLLPFINKPKVVVKVEVF